jgi:hypothetical protein
LFPTRPEEAAAVESKTRRRIKSFGTNFNAFQRNRKRHLRTVRKFTSVRLFVRDSNIYSESNFKSRSRSELGELDENGKPGADRHLSAADVQVGADSPRTVMDTVAWRIEQLVPSGELKPGDRLPPEPELAERLRVSRSSLREALKGPMYLGLIKSRRLSTTRR